VILIGFTFNKNRLVPVKEQKFVLGTLGGINVYSNTKRQGEKAISLAYERIEEIENLMSTSVEGSDIYNINKNAGIKPVKVDPSTMMVISRGLKYHDITQKTFNIGLGSLIELWGIGEDSPKVPATWEITEAKKHIHLDNLEISEKSSTVFIKDPEMSLDLGGIAKGYAVDEAVRILKENEIESGIVNLGGDIFTFGKKSDNTLWKIGISNPRTGKDGNVIIRILVADKSVVTSGDYERFFTKDGVKYHHIIDFKTGMPADNGVVSATVISDKCMNADIVSTAAFILGVEEGLQLIESQPNMEGLIITNNSEIYISSGLKDELQILDDNFKIVNQK
ncbi:MAG TPA: FAD:protein FMN transferase, partial [Oscillospiraceae bacterium]|nr:FAD:protein FMN transferase [Oscillospiraceae bacterium]